LSPTLSFLPSVYFTHARPPYCSWNKSKKNKAWYCGIETDRLDTGHTFRRDWYAF